MMLNFSLQKTRATAMLEKVSQPRDSPCCSPLALAQKWKIPILTVSNIWQWISKNRESVLNKINERKIKEEELNWSHIIVDATNSPFIKIESCVRWVACISYLTWLLKKLDFSCGILIPCQSSRLLLVPKHVFIFFLCTVRSTFVIIPNIFL